ncbi:sigma-70 family RNA polymerase sigma factor [Mycobacterium sp. pUA109]|uniref:sigma-70 family RNA polymerase sigma factor n=1 Tax=Mycobacterium sp. pUA109 TaxID=3238982 RepID=UPI00351B823B
MTEIPSLTACFEEARPRLRALAHRMLGSVDDAEDAVQEAWLRLRGDSGEIANVDAWLTTVVARICLNMLRARRTQDAFVVQVPDPVVEPAAGPEHQALLADSVGLALFVVLETLPPAERLALVLHDVFAVPFEDVAAVVDRTPAAARQLASRARRRIRDAGAQPDCGLTAQREVVDAFFAAGRAGDFDRLVSVLDPEVVARGDFGPGAVRTVRGAAAVAGLAHSYAAPQRQLHDATVNGAAGVVVFVDGQANAIMGFVVRGGRVAAIDVLADPARIARIDLSAVAG